MAGTNKLKPSKALQAKYLAYKQANRLDKNFRTKLERHLKKFPNDVQAQAALKKGTTSQRKAPTSSLGWYKGATQQTLRKEKANSLAKIEKITNKVAKTQYKFPKQMKPSPFYILATIKDSLPVFQQEANKHKTYKRMKTRTNSK